ncbi:carbohydrate sulfotransferase 4-like isoform X2 [Macrobrachium nipponense]|uniref:carbohydrate sulfotransferase 4-like isoform X2 n=1 Tax=Macrobrachium nipponense TaxID=159736 RepID=UPI0030C8CE33
MLSSSLCSSLNSIMFYERVEEMALTLRKQPGKTLLVILAGTSLVLLFFNQSDLRASFTHPAHLQSSVYSHRRIHDYSNPEYTAPGETGGETGGKTAKDRSGGPIAPLAAPNGAPFSDAKSIQANDEEGAAEEKEGADTPEEKDPEIYEDPPVAANQDSLPSSAIAVEQTDGGNEEEEEEAAAGKDLSGNERTKTTESDASGNRDVENAEEYGADYELYPVRLIRPATKQGFIDSIIEKQRKVLQEAMEGYTFHRKLKAKKLEDLVLEKGGRPVRSLVVTSWRSGSTFIGDVLQSHPATYYHYEPLLDFGIQQVRYGELAQEAVHNLRHLLTCNYSELNHYLDYGPEHPWLFIHNSRLWNYCTSFPQLCWDPDFLSPFCSLFPFQSMKTVRLRLNLTREFLEDKTLGVQVLLLVRDPRGTMQSRHHRDWCPGNPDCDDPAKLCQDLVSDYNTAIDFRRKFPSSFRVVRYEDLSFDAYNMTKELFDFFHLSYHARVQEFLDTHTKEKIGGVSSTFRNSKTAPVHWQQDLSWEEVEAMQKVCSKALRLWGYEIAKDENHLRTFKPVGLFKFR